MRPRDRHEQDASSPSVRAAASSTGRSSTPHAPPVRYWIISTTRHPSGRASQKVEGDEYDNAAWDERVRPGQRGEGEHREDDRPDAGRDQRQPFQAAPVRADGRR